MNALTALSQYGKMKDDTQTMYASPHQLMLMLFDGAIEAMSFNIGAIQQNDFEARGKQNTRAITIINGMRECLDMKAGGELADNLYALYQYMTQELFRANFNNDADTIQNIQTMLKDIRGSWEKIPLDMHYMQRVN
jgi:flagellar protein FliS|tara:strand:+ start:98 stop:505 length:408 start_codon:yes stop_codon:yes gene_type:complete